MDTWQGLMTQEISTFGLSSYWEDKEEGTVSVSFWVNLQKEDAHLVFSELVNLDPDEPITEQPIERLILLDGLEVKRKERGEDSYVSESLMERFKRAKIRTVGYLFHLRKKRLERICQQHYFTVMRYRGQLRKLTVAQRRRQGLAKKPKPARQPKANEPTEKQLGLCEKIGVEVSPGATKAEVGELISSRLAGLRDSVVKEAGLKVGMVFFSPGRHRARRVVGLDVAKGRVMVAGLNTESPTAEDLSLYPSMDFAPSEEAGIPEGFYPLATLLYLAKRWRVTSSRQPAFRDYKEVRRIFYRLLRESCQECSTIYGKMYKLESIPEVVALWGRAVDEAETRRKKPKRKKDQPLRYCRYCGRKRSRMGGPGAYSCFSCWRGENSPQETVRYCISCGTQIPRSLEKRCSACQS